MQLLQSCIGPTIRIGQESWCLPQAVFFKKLRGKGSEIYTDITTYSTNWLGSHGTDL